MATITKARCQAYKTISGNSPKITYHVQGTAETFKKGALLYLTSTMTVRKFPNGQASTAFDTWRTRILGIAGADATDYTLQATANAAGPNMPVYVANRDTLFMSNCCNRSVASTGSLAYADLGKVACASGNASMFFVELAASAPSSLLRIVEFVDAKGDLYGRVLWQLLHPAHAFRD